ncbi:MAG TPA: hypothetical protein VIG94_06990 [Faecalibacter sp.]|uniref:hypothetical protein n=1 Tax=Faecalibacter sp. LW9 TaxID=3103144 RepID=UPI002AFDEBB0|nr:hypothetical protein [Faecalibacter sp. LW9]
MKCLPLKFFIFILLQSHFIFAQYVLSDSIALKGSHFSHLQSNAIGDVFLIADDQQLLKIDQHKKLKTYPLKKLVSQLDTHLSLRTAVGYNFQEIEFLDDQLNPIQDRIYFNQYQIYPSAVIIADSQLLWYFDPIEQRLIQWNYQLKTTISKSNMLFFKDGDTTITDIYAIKNSIFLKSQNWMYEYDVFGNFKSEIPLKPHLKHVFRDDFIHLLDEQNLTSINLLTKNISTMDNFFNGKDFTMSNDQLFVIKNKGLYIYTRIKK